MFARLQRVNASVNALVHVAKPSASVVRRDGPLDGLTVAVKDNICTSAFPTTCASAMLAHYTSPFDATVVARLSDAGAHIIGKANCDEFGMGSLNTNSLHGPVVNPHQPPDDARHVPWTERERRSAGGSSGGSAASVAADLCSAALGTDTGGSVRLPASYCGVVGLKPSYGLVSRWGVVSFADSLDCVGVLAKSVGTVKSVFDVVSAHDARDPTAASPKLRKSALESIRSLSSSSNLDGLRIGIPQEYFPLELDPSVTRALRTVLERLKEAGASLHPVSLPTTPYALSAYYVIASAEASSNLARFDGIQYGLHIPPPPGASRLKPSDVYAHSRSAGFGREVKKRILLGTYALTAEQVVFDNYFLKAQRVRTSIKADFNTVFRHPCVHLAQPNPALDGVDVLVHPSAIRTAPRLPACGQDDEEGSSLDDYLQDVMTVPASLAGLPALSVPAGLGEDGWPVGVSIVGQWGTDELVLRVGHILESIQ